MEEVAQGGCVEKWCLGTGTLWMSYGNRICYLKRFKGLNLRSSRRTQLRGVKLLYVVLSHRSFVTMDPALWNDD